MTVFQCGFIASDATDPGCSKDIASAVPIPVPSKDLSRVFQGGWGFGLAASSSGELFVWGVNSATLLDEQGSADDGADPAALHSVLPGGGLVTAAAGFDHALVVTGGGVQVFGPQHALPGSRGLRLAPVGLRTPVVSVAAGEHHSLLLTSAGQVYAFGLNGEGQLGTGSSSPVHSDAPALVLGPGGAAGPIAAIAAGARHSLAAGADGRVHAWGWSLHGQAGTGEVAPSVPTPTLVAALGPLRVAGLAAGLGHSLALTLDGDVYAWGQNADGQLGNGTTKTSFKPTLVEAVSDRVTAVAAGSRHTLLLTQAGVALASGHGAFGATGAGKYEGSLVPVPMTLPVSTRVTAIAAGWWHSVLVVE